MADTLCNSEAQPLWPPLIFYFPEASLPGARGPPLKDLVPSLVGISFLLIFTNIVFNVAAFSSSPSSSSFVPLCEASASE